MAAGSPRRASSRSTAASCRSAASSRRRSEHAGPVWITSWCRPARTPRERSTMPTAWTSSLLTVFNRRCGRWQRANKMLILQAVRRSLTTGAICGLFVRKGVVAHRTSPTECWLVVRGGQRPHGGKEAHTCHLRRLLLPAGGSLRAPRKRAVPHVSSHEGRVARAPPQPRLVPRVLGPAPVGQAA